MKSIHLDIVRVTEAAAISAAKCVGGGDKVGADKVATEAMRERLNKIDFLAEITIGEGKKDESVGLFRGEIVGGTSDSKPQYSIAVDPIEGTTPVAKGGPEAMSVIAVANHGCFFSSECFYMKKLAVGPRLAGCGINVNDPLDRIIARAAEALNKVLMVCLLDRPRHEDDIALLRKLGCRIKLISDCDVSGSISTCVPESGIDLYYGIGGTPEGVISAAALKCMRGHFQGMLVDKDGILVDDKVYNMDDLASGDVVFCSTGITDGSLLRGVRFQDGRANTHSVLMRSDSGTIRWIKASHGN